MYKLIGVTGTVGKTTTCILLHKYLYNLNKNVISITTAGIYYNDKCIVNDIKSTSIQRYEFNNLLEIYKDEVDYIIIEMTAEIATTNQYNDLKFDLMALTNFKEGIVQSFKTHKEYSEAKLKLFNDIRSDLKVINLESEFIDYIHEERGIYTFSIYKTHSADVYVDYCNVNNLKLEVKFNIFDLKLKTNLLTAINLENLTCMVAILKALNLIKYNELNNLLSYVTIPGRLEQLIIKNRQIIIDSGYNGIEGLYPLVKFLNHDKTITVLCTYVFPKKEEPSPLIKSYREGKGLFFKLYSKQLFITSYNTYEGVSDYISNYEEDEAICNLARYIKDINIIYNREDAIQAACEISHPGDTILLIGKGNEITTRRFNGKIFEKLTDKDIIIKELSKEKYKVKCKNEE